MGAAGLLGTRVTVRAGPASPGVLSGDTTSQERRGRERATGGLASPSELG